MACCVTKGNVYFISQKSKNSLKKVLPVKKGLQIAWTYINIIHSIQCLSQELETGCLKLAVVKYLGVQIFKGGGHNILIFQP